MGARGSRVQLRVSRESFTPALWASCLAKSDFHRNKNQLQSNSFLLSFKRFYQIDEFCRYLFFWNCFGVLLLLVLLQKTVLLKFTLAALLSKVNRNVLLRTLVAEVTQLLSCLITVTASVRPKFTTSLFAVFLKQRINIYLSATEPVSRSLPLNFFVSPRNVIFFPREAIKKRSSASCCKFTSNNKITVTKSKQFQWSQFEWLPIQLDKELWDLMYMYTIKFKSKNHLAWWL